MDNDRCSHVHNITWPLVEHVLNYTCNHGDLEKARSLFEASLSPSSPFSAWLLSPKGRYVIENVINAHLEFPYAVDI